MNLPFFHQVIVAGGLDPELLQINVTDFDTDNGSVGFTNSTFVGSTENEKMIIFVKFEMLSLFFEVAELADIIPSYHSLYIILVAVNLCRIHIMLNEKSHNAVKVCHLKC